MAIFHWGLLAISIAQVAAADADLQEQDQDAAVVGPDTTVVALYPSKNETAWPKGVKEIVNQIQLANETDAAKLVVPVGHAQAHGSTGPWTGPDLTKSYPGEPVVDWDTHIRIVSNITMPEFDDDDDDDDSRDKVTTAVTITFQPPNSLYADNGSGAMKAIDPSWYLCQYFVPGTHVRADNCTDGEDGGCDSLSETCIKDIQAAYGGSFARRAAETTRPTTLGHRCMGDPTKLRLPESCSPVFEPSEDAYDTPHLLFFQDREALDWAARSYFSNTTLPNRNSFALGSGWNERGDETHFEKALALSWAVVTVWGYSDLTKDVPDNNQMPNTTVVFLHAELGPEEIDVVKEYEDDAECTPEDTM